jgi:hypothetical protein
MHAVPAQTVLVRQIDASGQVDGFHWSTDAGLRVGEPIAEIARLYPGLHLPYVGGGYSVFWLVPRKPSVSGRSLRAEAHAGRVDSISVLTDTTFIYQPDG